MWYKKAMAFGDSEGTIQCTYATIYDAQGRKVFSLQRRNFGRKESYNSAYFLTDAWLNGHYQNNMGRYGSLVYTGAGKEGIFYWDQGGEFSRDSMTGYVNIDFPLVYAEKWSGERLVPVKLLPVAVDFIKRSIDGIQKDKLIKAYDIFENVNGKRGNKIKTVYTLAEVFKYLTHGTWDWYEENINKKYWDNGQDAIDGKVIISPPYETRNPIYYNLYNRLNSTETFYIKPAAFNWHPVNVRIKEEKLNKLKADLDKAKALLIATGAATLI